MLGGPKTLPSMTGGSSVVVATVLETCTDCGQSAAVVMIVVVAEDDSALKREPYHLRGVAP